MKLYLTILLYSLLPKSLTLQSQTNIDTSNWIMSPGIIGTITLIVIVLVVAIIILLARLGNFVGRFKHQQIEKETLAFHEDLIKLEEGEIDEILLKRKKALQFRLKGNELGSDETAIDSKGLLKQMSNSPHNPFFDEKKKDKPKT